MTAETEAIKAQILSTGNAEILLEENDFLIVKWIKPEIKYSMAAYQYGKTGMANNYPWECSLTEEQIAFFLEHINAAVEYFKSKFVTSEFALTLSLVLYPFPSCYECS